jgi:hypothetical protein
MGTRYWAICNDCRHKFRVDEGGGFFCHLLKCDKCGGDKFISFDELGDVHLGYLKGLSGPYCVATSEHDKYVRENYPGESLTEEEYHQEVENIAGKCKCGGRYKFNAPPRCPKCKSTNIVHDPDGELIWYD